MSTQPRVVIVGAGFGGLAAARAMRGLPVEVTLVDRHNYHLFQPLLYQVASGLLDPSEIANPVRMSVRRARNVDVRMAEVTGVDLLAHRVDTSSGPIPYDQLVLATGSVTNDFGIARLGEASLPLKDLEQGLRLRSHVLGVFERASVATDADERSRLLSFVVVGGGPTGVEYSGALAELIEHVLPKDFPRLDFGAASITLVEAGNRLLGGFAPGLARNAARKLQRKGVRLRIGDGVRAFNRDGLILDGGEHIDAGTVVWTAGVCAGPLPAALGIAQGSLRRAPVTASLNLAGHDDVFVIGDSAEVIEHGIPLPMLAPVAIQQGRHVARVIAARLRGQPAPAFRYRDKGTMATIGRGSAVAQLGPIHVGGFLGWLMWLALHIIYIVGFRSRVVVLFSWAWNYFFYDRPVRLILPPVDTGGSPGGA